MANEQAQTYDSTLKEWVLQQPQAVIAVLLPGAIYQETVNVEVVRPTVRADKVFKVLYEGAESILHIEFESGANITMAARLLVYNALLYLEHNVPVISIVVYPFRTKIATSPLRIVTKRNEILTFHFQILPLFTLEAEQFIQNHVSCMYPLLPVMNGTTYTLIEQALNELVALYREDNVTLAQQIIWMQIFLERTDTVPQPEKYKIQERLSMYDQLWEESPKIQKIRAESEAKGEARGEAKGEARGEAKGFVEGEVQGRVEALQSALITSIELRFPNLSALAEKQVKNIKKPDMLDLLFRQITLAPDERTARTMLMLPAA